MTRFEILWGKVEDAIIGLFVTIALGLVCFEVMARYFVPSILPDWGGEVIIYLVIVSVMTAGSPLVLSGRHIRADLFVRLLPETGRRMIEFCNLAIGFLYCAIIAKFGYDVVEFARMLDIRSDSSIQFRQWIFYIILPLSFGLMTVRYGIQLYRFAFRFSPDMLPGHEAEDERIERLQS